MSNSILKLGLATVGIGGSVGLGACGIHYFQKNTEGTGGTIGDFFTSKGFKITSYKDSIWEEEFKRYEKFGDNDEFNATKLTSSNALRNKCREVTGKTYNESVMMESPNPFTFMLRFCAGKTPLLVTLKGNRDEARKLDINGDDDIWSVIAADNSAEAWADKIKVTDKNLNQDQWKQKIKDYCKDVNWDQEMRQSDWESPHLQLCTNIHPKFH